MDCRDFRNNHVGFVDDTLSAVETDAMRKHRDACAACSRHDTAVRRGLLLVRNLPRVDVSPDFMVRLNERLRNMPAEQVSVRSSAIPIATFVSIAAGIALVAFLGYEMSSRELTRQQQPMRLAPVVATRPALPPSPVATPVFAASASTGMGVWPAVLMAGEAQMHMASLELQDAR